MRILGIGINYKRKDCWNGETIRIGGVGVSGTDQSYVLICEYLASMGHDVYLSFDDCINNTVYNNVKYINTNQVSLISDTVDILIIPSWYNDFMNYYYKNLKKLVIWCHYQGFIHESILQIFKLNYPATKIYVNYLSEFVLKYINKYNLYYNDYVDNLFKIDNPLMFDQLLELEPAVKNSKSFIFFASFERGGEIAVNIFNKLEYINKKMTVCSYDINDRLQDIQNIESVDKSTLFRLLSTTEYFIYPLVLPLYKGSLIHKDTDGCCIAEALLNEVIVLTYPVGALREKYGDHLVYLPFPSNTNKTLIEGVEQVSVPEFHSDFVIKSFIDTIHFLENNPSYKNILKQRGRTFILQERSKEKIKNLWIKNLEI